MRRSFKIARNFRLELFRKSHGHRSVAMGDAARAGNPRGYGNLRLLDPE